MEESFKLLIIVVLALIFFLIVYSIIMAFPGIFESIGGIDVRGLSSVIK